MINNNNMNNVPVIPPILDDPADTFILVLTHIMSLDTAQKRNVNAVSRNGQRNSMILIPILLILQTSQWRYAVRNN
jgi:hypothetical protein